MTETGLSESNEENLTNDPSEVHQRRKVRRRLRRNAKIRKTERLFRIVNDGRYAPNRGYVEWNYEGRTLYHSGYYFKYPKNSQMQKWIKRATSRRVRRYRGLPMKGNHYRRLFDYWWTLY